MSSRGAETVLSRIEDLDLRRRFRCVLLASHFVNTEEAERDLLLDACARHLDDDGLVAIERYDPSWVPQASAARRIGDVSVAMRDVRGDGTRFSAVMEYEVEGRAWAQPFTAVLLDDDELGASLQRAGLVLAGPLDERGTWVEARLYSSA
jgi:hypothetical protein